MDTELYIIAIQMKPVETLFVSLVSYSDSAIMKL